MRLIYGLQQLRRHRDGASDTTATFDGIRIQEERKPICAASVSTTFYFPLPSFFLSYSISLLLHSIQSCLDNKRHSESVVTQPPAINSLPSLPHAELTDFLGAVDLMRETKSGGKAESARPPAPVFPSAGDILAWVW